MKVTLGMAVVGALEEDMAGALDEGIPEVVSITAKMRAAVDAAQKRLGKCPRIIVIELTDPEVTKLLWHLDYAADRYSNCCYDPDDAAVCRALYNKLGDVQDAVEAAGKQAVA